MGDCQNYGPFLGPYDNTGPSTGPNLGDPKRDHNFDNLPYGNNGKENGNYYVVYWGYTGIMEKKMETTI